MIARNRSLNLLLALVLAAGLFSTRLPAVQAAPDAALAPGDIAMIGFNFDNPENFAFVALVDITAGTQITFTDSGWKADQTTASFCSGEGGDTWTAPADVPAGTVITYEIGGVKNPNFQIADGWIAEINPQQPSDQLIAFTGTKAQPLPIYALNNTNTGGWQADCTNALTSALPHGLKDGLTAVAFNSDNAVYAGPTTGTREELLAAISNPVNWLQDNDIPFDFSIRFPPGGGNLELDNLPAVTAVVPGSAAVHVPLDANLQVTFSEPVTTAASWFTIECDSSGAHTAQDSASGSTYTLNPDINFQANESCTVTIDGLSITDQDGTAHAMRGDYIWSFTTLPPVVFRYHDLEAVVMPGETIAVVGDFNGWDATANPMTSLGGGLYSAQVEIPNFGACQYRYEIIPSDSPAPIQGLLDSANRTANFDSLPEQFDDHRNVAALDASVSPATVSINQGGSMPDFSGLVSIPGVTDQAGPGRGLKVDFGSGQDGQVSAWSTWAEMNYAGEQEGVYDRFTYQPALPAAGTYYYGIRFDANWGDGNPNAGWTYAGTSGILSSSGGSSPELEDPGELTVTAPDLVLEKTVLPASGVDLGDTVTYTLLLTNQGDGAATGVDLSDSLPAGLTFGEITSTEGDYTAGVISWSGSIAAGQSVQVVFTADLTSQAAVDAGFVTNTASFTAQNTGPGQDTVTFNTVAGPALSFTKTVTPRANVKLGDTVTYTLTLANSGDGHAFDVALTDTLPHGLTFGAIVSGGAAFSGGAVQWNGTVNAGQTATVIFTASVDQDEGLFGQVLTNTASFTSGNAGEGQAQATFLVRPKPLIYLPLMHK